MARLGALILVIGILFQTVVALFPEHQAATRNGPSDDDVWSTIKPSRDLHYYSCYGQFKCALLQVPLDWNATRANLYKELAEIAILKLPAKVPITNPAYGGPVFINPGGPGGSGTDFAQVYAEFFRGIFDSDKHFDVIGWDPRGVYQSKPSANCFRNNNIRNQWNTFLNDEGQLNEGERVLNMKWGRSHALGDLCAQYDFGPYVSTAFNARDMVEMIDKIEEHHKKEMATSEEGRGVLEARSKEAKEAPPKLQYVGFSYGTMLGNTFASIYPERVGRMVLDGVVDAPDYVHQGWKRNLQETETVLHRCYKYCFEAGPSKCALYNKNGPEAIRQDVDGLLQRLKNNPVPVITGRGKTSLVTYALVNLFLFQSLYNPTESFVPYSSVLAQIMKGEYGGIEPYVDAISNLECYGTGNRQKPVIVNEAQYAILCSDGINKTHETKSEFKQYLDVLESESSTAGAQWAQIRLACIGWKVRARWRFTGPFNTRTATPILFVGNSADPVTPGINTLRMSNFHPGSGSLIQNSEGHTALFSAPSNCTLNIVKKYLSTGKVPKQSARCPAAFHPFQKKPRGSVVPPRDAQDHGYDSPWRRAPRLRYFPLLRT